jgi:hypothetical protein
MQTLATLFREVLKRANPRVLAVVINHRRLAESNSLLCFTDTRVLFIANWKRVVTVVFVSTATLLALNDRPEARLLSASQIVLNCRTIAEKDDTKRHDKNEGPQTMPRLAIISRAWTRNFIDIQEAHDWS